MTQGIKRHPNRGRQHDVQVPGFETVSGGDREAILHQRRAHLGEQRGGIHLIGRRDHSSALKMILPRELNGDGRNVLGLARKRKPDALAFEAAHQRSEEIKHRESDARRRREIRAAIGIGEDGGQESRSRSKAMMPRHPRVPSSGAQLARE